MPAARSPLLVAFVVVSVAHLVLDAADAGPWDSITKCLIAPLLAAWVVEQRGPRLLVGALAACFLGDLFLEIDDLFIVGMAAFAVAHVCFITIFVRRGALGRLHQEPWTVVTCLAAAVVLVGWCWGGLEDDLLAPVVVYAVLLVGTATTALASDRRAGAGGVLFLVSDALIALGEAGRIDDDATLTGLAIMVLYVGALYLLTSGILARERRTQDAGAGFDPTIRTDCWPRLPAPRTR